MKPVFQNKFGAEEGNCFQAMLASVLELPLESVPDFMTGAEQGAWRIPLNTWLRQFNLGYIEIAPTYLPKGCIHEISGDSPRGLMHAVVGQSMEMIHDPHPSGEGILNTEVFGIFVALDPSKLTALSQSREPSPEIMAVVEAARVAVIVLNAGEHVISSNAVHIELKNAVANLPANQDQRKGDAL